VVADVITKVRVCAIEVTTTAPTLPWSSMSEQSRNVSRPQTVSYARRSDPYVYCGAGSQLSTIGSQQRPRCQSSTVVCNSVMTGGIISSTLSAASSCQRPSDAVASGLAYLRGAARQPLQTFGKCVSENCFNHLLSTLMPG